MKRIDGRHLNRNTAYDSDDFRNRWFSRETIAEIAADYGVSAPAIRKAALTRGYPNKKDAKYGEQNAL